jgi:predicted NAD-dependent protein-ADP-ribosyltransferase YbiA (DUF1768 family)
MKEKEIAFTKVSLPYGWLGNMSPYPVEYNGKKWRTTEALFQAMRFDDEAIQEMIRAEASPMGCKMKVKAIVKKLKESNELHKRTVEPLSEQDVKNMEVCVLLKIQQHPRLLKDLLMTGDTPIYEDVTKRGARGTNLFWGAMKMPDGSWKGENTLGKIWEKFRKEKLSYYTEFSKEEIYDKFQTGKDPYEHLKKSLSEGKEIQVLNLETMRWVECENPDWSLPKSRYRVWW